MPPPAVSPPALPAEARAAVLAWYDARGRALAFRATRDPYAILVSEVMAQQTQISRVVEAWQRFLDRFPTVHALAAATPADVLRAWQGMGYDRRALNLRRAAQSIVADHGGCVPTTVAELERLPGIGPYTARAVAAIAFGARVGAVDTNVRRVLGRALADAVVGAGDPTAAWLQVAADASVDPDRPADWTHAVMDLGAKLCRPRVPHCHACPLVAWCAFARDAPTDRGSAKRSRRSTAAAAPFASTTRWLRGRIVDRLRAAPDGVWMEIAAPIGDHDAAAIRAAIAALARDGILERDPTDPDRARLSIA
ncbi:MAG TPA: A/G-specific adenine glycosylase [Candidatus Limnocylindrales bacterium]